MAPINPICSFIIINSIIQYQFHHYYYETWASERNALRTLVATFPSGAGGLACPSLGPLHGEGSPYKTDSLTSIERLILFFVCVSRQISLTG